VFRCHVEAAPAVESLVGLAGRRLEAQFAQGLDGEPLRFLAERRRAVEGRQTVCPMDRAVRSRRVLVCSPYLTSLSMGEDV